MYILLGLLVPVGLLLAYASTRPDSFTVARSLVIDATPSTLFALIQDFREWAKWSPWDKLDPTMKRTFEGSERGVGARYTWEGNSKVGGGAMTIREVTEDARVALDLHFIKPIAANNTTVFTLDPTEGGTRVTWTMEGHNNLMAKLFGVFMNMDAMIGRDFEKGLAAMRDAARAG